MSLGVRVNPISIQPGDSIATRTRLSQDPKTGLDIIKVSQDRKVKTVGFCPSQPEFVHIDHECYDTRFSTIVKVI